ncbi:hypothetical protein GCM10010393_47100 [Streptomyces gobitricini]|uniref:Uncharacterized protein n=1 Tax=Streptomyces gobitricini TaxID=68211 RepID=A0ABN3MX43_9ACTN
MYGDGSGGRILRGGVILASIATVGRLTVALAGVAVRVPTPLEADGARPLVRRGESWWLWAWAFR